MPECLACAGNCLPTRLVPETGSYKAIKERKPELPHGNEDLSDVDNVTDAGNCLPIRLVPETGSYKAVKE